LIQEDACLLTTEAVLWEWMNALAAVGTRRTTAEGYRRCHQDPRIEVVPFAPDTIAAGVRFYEARGDKGWSLTDDCLSFLIVTTPSPEGDSFSSNVWDYRPYVSA